MQVRPPTPPARASRIKGWLLQLLLVLLLGALLAWCTGNVLRTLHERGIQAGFSFLTDPAGFDIGESWLAYDPAQATWRAFAVGVLNTLRVALPAIVLATLLGTLIGIGRLSALSVPRRLCGMLVETLRNIPLLLQLLMCYFALTSLLPDTSEALTLGPILLSKSGLFLPDIRCDPSCHLSLPSVEGFGIEGGWSLTPEYAAVLIALSLYTAVFIAEIVRGGIQSVPAAQLTAAQALGLTPWQVFRHVTAPLALRAIIPALTNQYLNLSKNSSLAVAVGYPDIVSIANTSLNQSGRAFECIVIVMLIYATLSLLTAIIMNRYNRRVALRGQA
jgi:general L-amino acid transport system permease protein